MRQRSCLQFLTLAIFLLVPLADASAQENTASAGTLIGSVMEQVGYHAQADVLTTLDDLLSYSAALIFVGVMLSAVMTVALGGAYRGALWMLIGPPLFFWLTGLEVAGEKNTVQGAGVEWRFGAFEDSAHLNQQQQMLTGTTAGQGAEVSFFFHKYNELISEVSQKLIDVLTSSSIEPQMLLMARQRVMESIFASDITDHRLNSLIGYFVVQCSTELTYATQIARGNRDPEYAKTNYYKVANQEYCKLMKEKDKPFQVGDWQKFAYETGVYEGTDITFEEYMRGLHDTNGMISCGDMWRIITVGAKNEVLTQTAEGMEQEVEPSAWVSTLEGFDSKILQEILEKLTGEEDVSETRKDSPGDPCPEVSGSAGALTGDAGQQQLDAIARIFASFLIKERMNSTPFDSFLYTHTERGQNSSVQANDGGTSMQLRVNANPVKKQQQVRAQRQHEFGAARRYEAFLLIHLLPYVQGLLLYVLSVSYPFFALFVVLPGRAGNFFAWCALWAWVKSWDVGWAMITMADNILWELLPKAAYYNPTNDAQYKDTTINMLEAAFDGDHSYSIATYWMLLSGMVLGVPIVSGHAVLGAKKALAGMMLRGVTDFSETLSKGASDWIGGGNTRNWVTARERASFERMHQQAIGNYNSMDGMSNDLHAMMADTFWTEALGTSEAAGNLRAAVSASMKGKRELASLRAQRDALAVGASTASLDADIAKKEAEIKDVEKSIDTTMAEGLQKMKERGKGQDLTGMMHAGWLAKSPKVGAFVAKHYFGVDDADPEKIDEILKEGIAKALDTDVNKIKESLSIDDDEIAGMLAMAKMNVLLARAQAHQQSDLASFYSSVIGPMAAKFGGQAVGPVGSGLGLLTGEGAAYDANTSAVELYKQGNAYENRLFKQSNRMYHFMLADNPSLLFLEASRADASGNRREWWGNMYFSDVTSVPFQLDQDRREFSIQNAEIEARTYGAALNHLLEWSRGSFSGK